MSGARFRSATRWLALRLALVPVLFVASSGVAFFVLEGPVSREETYYCTVEPCERFEEIREELGLNDAWHNRWGDWLADSFRGDFGRSFVTNDEVTALVRGALVPSASLLIVAVATSTAVALWLSALARRSQRAASLAGLMAVLLMSVPAIGVIPLLLWWPADWFDYVPPVRASWRGDFLDALQFYIPPGVLVGLLAAPFLIDRRRGALGWPGLLHPGYLASLFLGLVLAELSFGIRGEFQLLMESMLIDDTPVAVPLITVALTVALFAGSLQRERDGGQGSVIPRWNRRYASLGVLAALGLVLLFGGLALLGPFFTGDAGADLSRESRSEGASLDHLLGTDVLGRDMLARVVHGLREALVYMAPVLLLGFAPGAIAGHTVARTVTLRVRGLVARASTVLSSPWCFLLTLMVLVNGRSPSAPAIVVTALLAFVIGARIALEIGPVPSHQRLAAFGASAAGVAAMTVVSLESSAFFGLFGDQQYGLGVDVNRGVQFGVEGAAFYGPLGALCALLFALNLLAVSLRDLAHQPELSPVAEIAPSALRPASPSPSPNATIS